MIGPLQLDGVVNYVHRLIVSHFADDFKEIKKTHIDWLWLLTLTVERAGVAYLTVINEKCTALIAKLINVIAYWHWHC